MPKYKLNPIVISCGMKGNKILKDHSLELPETNWEPGVAAELVKKGFLIPVDEVVVKVGKAETAKTVEVVETSKEEDFEQNMLPEKIEELISPPPTEKKQKRNRR